MTETAQTRLEQRMAALQVREEDIEERFTRGSGPGGQNVNKTSSTVVLVHKPTGIQVRCQAERSQGQNRVGARELLLNKLETHRQQQRDAERARIEKVRRQKRKRPRAAQERILQNKARQAAKKRLRARNYED